MFKLHTYCRACGYAKPGAQGIKSELTEKLIEVMDLGVQPLANDFCKDGESHAGYAPLKVLYCPRCSLGQLSVVVDPKILFSRYSYVTSTSSMMREHFLNLITDIEHETKGMNVLEIGSNDGRLLHTMKEGGGYSVTGVDPAANLAAIAQEHGIPTEVGFFGCALASRLPKFDVVIARHVFCHVDDWQDFVRGLETVSHPKTLICIEVPCAGDTIKGCEFDTCLTPGQKIITEHGLEEIQNVRIGQKVLTHTGNFRDVTNVFSRPYAGEIVEIIAYGQNTPLTVTPEHPVYVCRGEDHAFVQARDVKAGDRLLKPSIKKRLDYSEGLLTMIHPHGNDHQPSKTDFPINEHLCKIFGFYLAEGFFYENKKGGAAVTFAFGKSESEKKLAEECSKALKWFGAKGRTFLTKYGWHVETYGNMARLLNRELGTGAFSKHIPSWIFLENDRNIETLVWAYVRGDGYVYRNGNYWRASTVSEDLAQGIAVLANKLGFAASVNIGKPLGLKRIHKNLQWSLLTKPPIDVLIRIKQTRKIKTYCDGSYQFGLVRAVSVKNYDGLVHNIDVDEDRSYVCVQGAVHNCYHEHLSYLTIKSVQALLKDTSLRLHKIIPYKIHGGAILLMLRHKDSARVGDCEFAENITVDDWKQFAAKSEEKIANLRGMVRSLRSQGKRVAGLGASAKSTVWISACGFTRKDIAFIADNTPQKQWTFSPGTDIPVVDEGAVLRELPDYLVIFCWNFLGPELLEKFALARSAGMKFIVPVPTIKTI